MQGLLLLIGQIDGILHGQLIPFRIPGLEVFRLQEYLELICGCDEAQVTDGFIIGAEIDVEFLYLQRQSLFRQECLYQLIWHDRPVHLQGSDTRGGVKLYDLLRMNMQISR